MSDLIKAAHLRCTLSIKRLYPSWKQVNILLDGTPAEKDAFLQWRELNKTHLRELKAMIGDGLEVDIDAGWPDHEAWEPEPYVEQDLSDWGSEALNKSLEGLEAAQQRIGSVSMSVTLPVELEKYAEAGETKEETHERLRRLWMDYTQRYISDATKSQALPQLTEAERALYKELSPHFGKAVQT